MAMVPVPGPAAHCEREALPLALPSVPEWLGGILSLGVVVS
jgi:hypothetical protein